MVHRPRRRPETERYDQRRGRLWGRLVAMLWREEMPMTLLAAESRCLWQRAVARTLRG